MTTSPQSEERRTVDDRNQQSVDENPVDLKNPQENQISEENQNGDENRLNPSETTLESNDCDVNVTEDYRKDDVENEQMQNNVDENIVISECQQTQNQQESQQNVSNSNESSDKDNATDQDDKQAKDNQNQNNENHNRNHPGRSPRANRKISKEEKNDKDSLQPPPQFTAITEDKPPMDFDDLLPHVGEFGLYQKILFLMMIPFLWCVAFVYFGQIFFTMVPELHWCKVDALKSLPQEIRRNLSIPIDEEGGFEKCRVYAPPTGWQDVLKQNRTMPDPSWPIKPCDEGWEYDRSEIPYDTISTELDWVCSNAALPSISQSIFFVGAILGGLIFGWMADRFGRIPALVWSNIAGLIGGILTAFAQNFWQFTVCRFIVGLAFDNCFTMMYILVLEYVGPQWRTFVANMSIALFFTLASCVLPWMAIYIADWRWLAIITSLPLAVAIITPCTVPESARWLVSQGKMERAIGILKKFEKINGKDIDPKIFQEYQASVEKERNSEEGNKTYSVLDLFKTPRLRKITIILILIWMAISLVFDGHVRNVGSLGLNVFLTFTIASATELPADTFLTLVLDRWGRRWLACGTMVISGVFSLLATTVPQGVPSASLAIVGRFCVNISYNIGLQYAAELLPTVVRAQGVALIHIMGYVATIISPFVVYLATVDTALPLYVLGSLGVLGGVLALYLPETMDQELPQTLADGEEFGKGQTMWDIPCVKKKPPPPPVSSFSKRASIRASVRGEQYRSNLINRRLSKISNKDNNLI